MQTMLNYGDKDVKNILKAPIELVCREATVCVNAHIDRCKEQALHINPI